jgi:hypothetical protein
MPRCRTLEDLICQIVREDLQRTRVFENDKRTCRLDCSSGMHGNGCGVLLDTFGELFCIVPLVLACKQYPEVLYELVMWGIGRAETRSAWLAGGRQLDSIGWKSVSHERNAHALCH